MTLAGYEILAELVHGELHSVHRGRRETDGPAVLVKGPRRHPARPHQVEALRRECALRKDLHVREVPRVFDLVCREGGCWLVLEDPGGVPLPTLLGSGPMDLSTFFPLALPLVAILAELHRLEIVHQNPRACSSTRPPTSSGWTSSAWPRTRPMRRRPRPGSLPPSSTSLPSRRAA